MKRAESESHLIDRLVLGIPPDAVLIAQARALHDWGWTWREIGALWGLQEEAIAKRVSRAAAAERGQ